MSYRILLLSTLILSACGGVESDAKTLVRQSLKDPDSAKFGAFTKIDDSAACLTVNAKNSMGGYTGDQQAVLIKDSDGWFVVSISDYSHEQCISVAKKLIKK